MEVNVIDAMQMVSNAVWTELNAHGIASILADDGLIRLSSADRDYPTQTVWCEIHLQSAGVVQPLRTKVTVHHGQMAGDHNPVIRTFVDGALEFNARATELADQRRSILAVMEKVTNEARSEGMAWELLSIRRMELDAMDRDVTDAWDLEMLMYGETYENEVVHQGYFVSIKTDEVDSLEQTMREYWLPHQRKLHDDWMQTERE